MKLVIVESPAKTKTISKYLGNGYVVKASIGHIRDLPKSNKQAIDIAGGFIPHYEVSPGKEKVVREIKGLAKKASEVILATDPDREGEAIAWHVAEAAGLGNTKNQESKTKVRRIVFNEITETAVREAIQHPREIDAHLVKAQEARRVLDRLFGYDLSGLIWKKVRYGLSAGRVQSPALRIIMEREREIRSFVPETYWTIFADLRKGMLEKNDQEVITFTCTKEPRDRKEVDRIVARGESGQWFITDVKESQQKRTARAPFTTSTLQQAASSRLGYAPSKTMGVAQKLYEAGLITYMRTDSTTLAKEAQSGIVAFITKEFGARYAAPKEFRTKSKSAQEAHEAIRPTDASRRDRGDTEEQRRIYHLIWARTVASQMADALLLKTKVLANVKNDSSSDNIPDFALNGSRILFDGWLAADRGARGEDTIVPKLAPNDALSLSALRADEKATEPPARYTEAGLVKELEKRGIGRPSTYASIIKTIQDRGYVTRQGKTLFPTDTGDVVSTFLEHNFEKYISDSFTAEMENELDEIADGTRAYKETLAAFYTPFTKDVAAKQHIEKLTTLGDADSAFPCPQCCGKMVIKLGRTGTFMSCARFPDCSGARTMAGEEMTGPKELGEQCPECDKPLVERTGRFGKFIACSNYPKCKYVRKSEEEEEKAKTGVKCPHCALSSNGGELVERRGRFGAFYSCSRYPKCKYAIKSRPTGRICPDCGALMMEGTKTIPERCSDKKCPRHNPHKIKTA